MTRTSSPRPTSTDGAGPPPEGAAQTAAVTQRQRWAVETMAVAPDDRVLEIGCGRGVAVSLVARRLTTGRIVAIDRSATMVRLAAERNASHVESGRAEIRQAGFESVDLPTRSFTKIFAVNVNLFWVGAAAEQIDRMRELLVPGGRLYVFGERPTAAHATANLRSTERLLRAQGFETAASVAAGVRGRLFTCVVGATVD
ncbi:class I SAM-dependent methyltransferase [Micromonospora sp. NPDC049366]|uniref:class I SAM-dependent methyltransferase n=1 Tax=Micromonospora sp. NPDC049366 TaxID=3364271 RepID=UPI0037BCA689